MSRHEQKLTWILEAEVFPASHKALAEAVLDCDHGVLAWDDDWWSDDRWPRHHGPAVVFHGSLGNADRIRRTVPWRPGAYCDSEAFRCSAWYPRAEEWLVQRPWRVLPAEALVADPSAALAPLGSPRSVFVRPDSPLKPFSGRVLACDQITLAALDHGFYYEDPTLPVVVAPVRAMGREWRYVVVDREPVAGSAYTSATRSATPDDSGGASWAFAAEVARRLDPPEEVYVMDICESDGRLWLLELNPFSGADLYACDPHAVVEAVSQAALRAVEGSGS